MGLPVVETDPKERPGLVNTVAEGGQTGKFGSGGQSYLDGT